jgi:Tfp pilus assembly protein PilF
LGDLYQYYIKDYLKAESQFKQAVANDPKYIPSYLHLADLYTNSYQTSTNKGELVLKDGLAKNPGDIMLSLALGAYYKSRGNTESAKTIYNEVLTKAKTAKNQNLIDQVTALLNELEK